MIVAVTGTILCGTVQAQIDFSGLNKYRNNQRQQVEGNRPSESQGNASPSAPARDYEAERRQQEAVAEEIRRAEAERAAKAEAERREAIRVAAVRDKQQGLQALKVKNWEQAIARLSSALTGLPTDTEVQDKLKLARRKLAEEKERHRRNQEASNPYAKSGLGTAVPATRPTQNINAQSPYGASSLQLPSQPKKESRSASTQPAVGIWQRTVSEEERASRTVILEPSEVGSLKDAVADANGSASFELRLRERLSKATTPKEKAALEVKLSHLLAKNDKVGSSQAWERAMRNDPQAAAQAERDWQTAKKEADISFFPGSTKPSGGSSGSAVSAVGSSGSQNEPRGIFGQPLSAHKSRPQNVGAVGNNPKPADQTTSIAHDAAGSKPEAATPGIDAKPSQIGNLPAVKEETPAVVVANATAQLAANPTLRPNAPPSANGVSALPEPSSPAGNTTAKPIDANTKEKYADAVIAAQALLKSDPGNRVAAEQLVEADAKLRQLTSADVPTSGPNVPLVVPLTPFAHQTQHPLVEGVPEAEKGSAETIFNAAIAKNFNTGEQSDKPHWQEPLAVDPRIDQVKHPELKKILTNREALIAESLADPAKAAEIKKQVESLDKKTVELAKKIITEDFPAATNVK